MLAELSVKVNSATSSLRRALKLPAQQHLAVTTLLPLGNICRRVCITFIGFGRKQSKNIVQPEPHHRCASFQVSTVDLGDGRDTDK